MSLDVGNPEVITVANRAATGIETAPSKNHPGRHARTLDFSASLSRNLGLPEILGSGKSLTYLIPIVDHVLRTQPEKHKVRAIIVYPIPFVQSALSRVGDVRQFFI